MALLATTMQGEDEAMTIPVLKEPLFWSVSEGSQTEAQPGTGRATFLYRRRQVISWHMCKCLGKYQQEHMNIAWWLAMPVSVGPSLEGKLVHPSESHFCHACWALLPAWYPDPIGQQLDKHQQQLFISHWK